MDANFGRRHREKSMPCSNRRRFFSGRCFMGMKALKIITDYDSIKESNYISINPDSHNNGLYKKHNNVYKNLYPLLKPAMHELYEIAN